MKFKIIILLALTTLGAVACAQQLATVQQSVIIQTNSRDEVIHLIDPATQEIIAQIEGIPVNHGAAGAPEGNELYFSS